MKKYMEEEKAAEAAAASMRERIDARKRELASTKKDQEDEQMKKYMEARGSHFSRIWPLLTC